MVIFLINFLIFLHLILIQKQLEYLLLYQYYYDFIKIFFFPPSKLHLIVLLLVLVELILFFPCCKLLIFQNILYLPLVQCMENQKKMNFGSRNSNTHYLQNNIIVRIFLSHKDILQMEIFGIGFNLNQIPMIIAYQ